MIDYRQAARVAWYMSGGLIAWLVKAVALQAVDDIRAAWQSLTDPETWERLQKPPEYIESDIWTAPADSQELEDARADLSDYYYLLDMAQERYENAGRPATRETAKRQIIGYRNKIRKLENRIEQLESEE